MSNKEADKEINEGHSQWDSIATVAALVLVIIAVYSNSFQGVYVLDDHNSIPLNQSIKTLWPLSIPLSPPQNTTTAGRPLLNFSFAVNHALDGTKTRGYHLVNLLIHIAAAVTLLAIVRSVLSHHKIPDDYRGNAMGLSFAIGLIWAVHPMQTESVTYLVQRAESLSGLLVLLCFWCGLKAINRDEQEADDDSDEDPRDILVRASTLWKAASIFVCVLAVGVKESAAIAPILLLLYDRFFCTASWRETIQQRRGFYACFLIPWAILVCLIFASGFRQGAVSGDSITIWRYTTTQIFAITQYVRLAIWPDALVFDYGTGTYGLNEVWLRALLLATLIALTLFACKRKLRIGFLGIAFFLCLAPTSSFLPIITQTIAEHRMYLALAPICALFVFGVFEILRRLNGTPQQIRMVGVVLLLVVATGLAYRTYDRNRDYHSAIELWNSVVDLRPDNQRAHAELGNAYFPDANIENSQADLDKAMEHYRKAIKLDEDFYEAHYNLGNAYHFQKKNRKKAIHHYEEALRVAKKERRMKSDSQLVAHQILGSLLFEEGRVDEGIEHFDEVYRHASSVHGDEDLHRIYQPLINYLLKRGVKKNAIPAYLEARQFRLGDGKEIAIRSYRLAIKADPQFARAYYELGTLYLFLRDHKNAEASFKKAIEINPDSPARDSLKRQ